MWRSAGEEGSRELPLRERGLQRYLRTQDVAALPATGEDHGLGMVQGRGVDSVRITQDAGQATRLVRIPVARHRA